MMKSYLPTITKLKANQMAHYFFGPVCPNEIVTVSLDRSQILLLLFFAVLQWCMLRSYR
jgi:hypothetical protein